jgi:hypothetical protein
MYIDVKEKAAETDVVTDERENRPSCNPSAAMLSQKRGILA